MASIDVAIAGVGSIGFPRSTADSVPVLAERALSAALEDAGLERSSIDALFVHIGSPRGLDYDAVGRLLALDVGVASQTWSHGRFTATLLQHAALMLHHGLARYALCLGAFRNSQFDRHGTPGFPDFAEALRDGGGPHGEQPAAGLLAPVGGAAMATRRYMHVYGLDPDMLGAVAVVQRRAAQRNPAAALQHAVTLDDYRSSPFVVAPLRRLDCSIPVDVAVALLLTTTERAGALRAKPVRMLGLQGIHASPNEFVFGQPGLGFNQRDEFTYKPLGAAEPVFAAAGLWPADVDALYCYDGFSTQVLWTLERFGFCAPGEANDWVQHGRIEIGGELPVNTNGGHLSEGHSNGWGHTVEIVRQLRGEAGPRQIEECECAMWATTFGDAIIYGT